MSFVDSATTKSLLFVSVVVAAVLAANNEAGASEKSMLVGALSLFLIVSFTLTVFCRVIVGKSIVSPVAAGWAFWAWTPLALLLVYDVLGKRRRAINAAIKMLMPIAEQVFGVHQAHVNFAENLANNKPSAAEDSLAVGAHISDKARAAASRQRNDIRGFAQMIKELLTDNDATPDDLKQFFVVCILGATVVCGIISCAGCLSRYLAGVDPLHSALLSYALGGAAVAGTVLLDAEMQLVPRLIAPVLKQAAIGVLDLTAPAVVGGGMLGFLHYVLLLGE